MDHYIILTQHYVSLLGFLLKQSSIVKVAIDKLHFRVLAGNLGTLVAISDKARNLELRMGIGDYVKSITANVSCCASAMERVLVREGEVA